MFIFLSRSRWKLIHFTNSIWRKIIFFKKNGLLKSKKIFYERSSTIPSCFNFSTILIHKGLKFRKLNVTPSHIGFKLGEFSFTRKPYHFPLKKNKRIKK